MLPEALPGRADNASLAFEEYTGKLDEAVEHHRQEAPEVYTAAFYGCFGEALADSSFDPLIGQILDLCPKLQPSEAAYKVAKSVQALEQAQDPSFPVGRDHPEAWEPVFKRLVADDEYRGNFLTGITLPIASNVSERSKLLMASLVLKGKPGPINILDMGCSLNHIWTRLARYDLKALRYEDTEVMRTVPADIRSQPKKDYMQSWRLNHVLKNAEVTLGPSIGMDVHDAGRDPVFKNWASSNSFYMGELLDQKRRRQFDILNRAQPRQVGFLFGDITAWKPEATGRRFDVAYLSTMLYQLKPDEVTAALSNAERSLKPDGLVVCQDFVDVKPDGSFDFDKHRGLWSYRVWVKDMARSEEGFQEYFRARTGRAREVVLGAGLGQLAMARELGLTPRA